MKPMLNTTIFLLAVSLSFVAQADLESRGEIKLENRSFADDNDSLTYDSNAGVATRIEVKNTHSKFVEKLQIFSRIDSQDSSRNIYNIEEAFLGYLTDSFEIKAGKQILNWSAAEAFHPADIINSRNLDSNFENAEKFGEQILSVSKLFDSGSLALFYMPYFQKPNLPSGSNRLSLLPNSSMQIISEQYVDKDNQVQSTNQVAQYALKFDWSFDTADISFHLVDHIDRSQPVVSVLSATSIGLTYLPVLQSGLTYRQTLGDFVFKSEIAHRDFHPSERETYNKLDHTQVALGTDYGWSTEGGAEVTLLMEYQTIPDISDLDDRASLSIFQNDILLGFRFAFNDVSSQEILFTSIFDLERDDETMLNINYSRRITDTWSMKTGARAIIAPQKGSTRVGLESLDQADQVFLDISRRF